MMRTRTRAESPCVCAEEHCLADEEIDRFITHDPNTSIIYVPGWGQVITRHEERLLERMRPLVSQFIRHADPDRVNTFYVITHVDLFHARDRANDDTYIHYDEATGELTFSEEFQQDIAYWDEMLTELIDPLAAAGYIQWSSLPEMGQLYLEWEVSCDSARTSPGETLAGQCGECMHRFGELPELPPGLCQGHPSTGVRRARL